MIIVLAFRRIVFAIALLSAAVASVRSAKAEAQTGAPATFAGAKACAGCHAPETERWKTSHHALAMLNSTGSSAEAMELLENTHKRHPVDKDTLLALVSIARETGDFATALTHARELVALYPTDMQLRLLVLDLEKHQAH
jgi:cytochrome c553